jgi:hypothetical protein
MLRIGKFVAGFAGETCSPTKSATLRHRDQPYLFFVERLRKK